MFIFCPYKALPIDVTSNTLKYEGKRQFYPCFICSTINMLTMIFYYIVLIQLFWTTNIFYSTFFAHIIYGYTILWIINNFYHTKRTLRIVINNLCKKKIVLPKKFHGPKKLYCQKMFNFVIK